MRLLVVAVAISGCKHHDAKPAPPPAPAPAPAPAPVPATLAPGEKLRFADFWAIAGVTRADTAATVTQKWGTPDEHAGDGMGGDELRYKQGPQVSFRGDQGIQIDFAMYGDELAFAKAHPDKKLALLGMTCADAASHLGFTDKVEAYTTCKHYDANGWLVDVTLTCPDKVTGLTVVWYPLGDVSGQKLPEDHCGEPKD